MALNALAPTAAILDLATRSSRVPEDLGTTVQAGNNI